MKPQATTNQIQNTKFVLNFILSTTFKNMAYIQKHPACDLYWKASRLDESKLSSSYRGISCLKNVQK